MAYTAQGTIDYMSLLISSRLITGLKGPVDHGTALYLSRSSGQLVFSRDANSL